MKVFPMTKRSLSILGLFTTIGIIVMAIFVVIFPHLYHSILQKQMRLVEGSSIYEIWKKPKHPVVTNFYFFNVTNVDDVKNLGAKPHLQEVGPYSFSEQLERVNIRHNHSNGTVSYSKRRTWHFNPALSKGSLDDHVTTINMPLMGALANIEKMSFFTRFGLFSTINALDIEPFVTHSAGELLFDGYEDVLLTMKDMMDDRPKKEISMDKFGWFYKRNGTTWGDGVYNTFTGEKDPVLFGKIDRHNYQQRTHYPGNCGQIRGSAEGFFPMFADLGAVPQTLELFTQEICSVMYLKKEDTIKVHGMDALKYILDNKTLANGSVFDSNSCYNNNLPSGVKNITLCKSQDGIASPIFLSFPHFYTADEWYLNQFSVNSDLNPQKEAHETRMVIQSQLSVPLEMAFRLQLVVKANRFENLRNLANLPDSLYLPCIWFEAFVDISKEDMVILSRIVLLPTNMAIGMSVALVISISSLIIVIVAYTKSDEDSHSPKPIIKPALGTVKPGEAIEEGPESFTLI